MFFNSINFIFLLLLFPFQCRFFSGAVLVLFIIPGGNPWSPAISNSTEGLPNGYLASIFYTRGCMGTEWNKGNNTTIESRTQTINP